MSEQRGWIAVDLDGTLAQYDKWISAEHIGEPVAEMVRKVKAWLAAGEDVRIFTARVAGRLELDDSSPTELLREADRVEEMIHKWCETHLGQVLPITCSKDFGMKALYDDRCVYVFPNQGVTHVEHQGMLQLAFLEVAKALGVRCETGMNFKDVGDQCVARARAGAAMRGHQYEAVLALLDSTADTLLFASRVDGLPAQARADIETARRTFNRAIPLLRELAKG